MKRINKRVNFGLLLILGLFALPMACSSPRFELVDGYIYKQHSHNEDPDRWQLVWEDHFDSLKTQFWTPIDLYRSPRFTNRMPQLLEDQNAWREITNLWASFQRPSRESRQCVAHCILRGDSPAAVATTHPCQ